MNRPRLAALVVAVLGLAACNNGSSSSSSSTLASLTTPTPTIVTENFTGTVQVQGLDFHSFTVSQQGTVTFTLTAAGPPSTIYMGMGVGVPGTNTDGTANCTLISGASALVQASSAAQLSGTAAAGSFCVAVFDVGNATGPVDYAVTVTHP